MTDRKANRNEYEELKLNLAAAQGDARIDILNKMSELALEWDAPLAEQHARDNLAAARRNPLSKSYRNAVFTLGLAVKMQSKYEEALQIMNDCLEMGREADDAPIMFNATMLMGNIYREIGMYEKSLGLLLKCLEFGHVKQEDELQASVGHNIGNVYSNLKMYQEALEWLYKTLAIRERLGDRGRIAKTLNSIGSVLVSMQMYDKGIECLQRSIRINEELNHNHGIAIAKHALGEAFLRKEDPESALQCHRESLEICEKLGLKYGIAASKCAGAQCLLVLLRFDEAHTEVSEALAIAEDLNLRDLVATCYGVMGRIHVLKGEFEPAYHLIRKYTDLHDQLLSESHMKAVAELRVRYDLEKRERENELFRQHNAELTQTLEELRKAQREIIELERRNSVLATVVTLSHEIKQPLTVIYGTLDLMRGIVGTPDSAQKLTAKIGRIEEAVNRISDVIGKLGQIQQVEFECYADTTDMVNIDGFQGRDTIQI